MNPWIVNRAIFPLHERLKGKPTHPILGELETSQWLDPGAIRQIQFRKLRRHLDFAYREVPYYTRLLDDHGLQPWRIQNLADFARIPFLTKDIVRAHFKELQPRTPLRGVQRLSSGGSTGAPVTVMVDRLRAAFTDATRLRAHRWFGADIGVREVVLWGSPIELTRQDRIRAVRDRLINSRLLSAFDLSEAAMTSYGEVLRRYRPVKMYGYASALALLAGYLARQGWTPGDGWPRVIFTTAEPLYDFQRALLKSVFGCPVSVEYGCRDGGLVANECPDGGLHVPSVREFQIVQEQSERLDLRIVPNGTLDDTTRTMIVSRLRRLFEANIDVRIEIVDTIPRPSSGKYRYVMSKVAENLLGGLTGARA